MCAGRYALSSIRTDEWRYTAWVGWNGTTLQPRWDVVNATELYDHRLEPGGSTDQDFDAWENANLAGDSALAPVVATLHTQLKAHFDKFAMPYVASAPSPDRTFR